MPTKPGLPGGDAVPQLGPGPTPPHADMPPAPRRMARTPGDTGVILCSLSSPCPPRVCPAIPHLFEHHYIATVLIISKGERRQAGHLRHVVPWGTQNYWHWWSPSALRTTSVPTAPQCPPTVPHSQDAPLNLVHGLEPAPGLPGGLDELGHLLLHLGTQSRPGGPRNLWGPAGSCPEMPSDACPHTHPLSELNLLALVLLLQLLHASSLFWSGQGGSGRVTLMGTPPKTCGWGGQRGGAIAFRGRLPTGRGRAWAWRVTSGATRGKGQGRGHCGGVARRPPLAVNQESERVPRVLGAEPAARGGCGLG